MKLMRADSHNRALECAISIESSKLSGSWTPRGGRSTILLVHLRKVKRVLTVLYNVEVALVVPLVVPGDGRQLGTRKLGQTVQEQSLDDQAGKVDKDGRGKSLPRVMSQETHDEHFCVWQPVPGVVYR